MDPNALLRAYDDQLRTHAETSGAISVTPLGPLLAAIFGGGHGVVTYRDLGGADAAGIRRLVRTAREFFAAERSVTTVEWKSRGHDDAPGLRDALAAADFAPEEDESIMLGEASDLTTDVPLPDGVRLRAVTDERDLRAVCAVHGRVFGAEVATSHPEVLRRRLARDDGTEQWVAEVDGEVVSVGRLEPVAGTDFAGVWGGATLAPWRGRGIYRALTAARARSALALGKTLIHSDSTEYSRPILERSGLVKVSTTTPYVWRR